MREMKDSGVEWIGEIPKEWETIKLKMVYNSSNAGEIIDKGYWNVGQELLYTCQRTPMMSNYDNFPNIKRTTNFDLLLTRNATPYIFIPKPNAIYSNVVQRITISKHFDRNFIRYALQCGVDALTVQGDTIPSYNMQVWNNIYIPKIPLNNQQRISAYLDDKCTKIDSIIDKQQTIIEKLKAYKQSVITEAVTKGLNPDVKMKDSGVEWIGEIPENWKILSLKYICTMQAGKNITSEEIQSDGNYPVYGGNGIRGYYSEFNNDGEYLLIGRQGALCGNVHRVNEKFWATEHAVVTYTNTDNTDYLYYLLIGMNLNQYVSSVAAQPGLSVSTILKVKATKPPIEEQQQIADYLDKKCSAIDSAIEKKQAIIEKLTEYKKSLIYEVVTGKKEV